MRILHQVYVVAQPDLVQCSSWRTQRLRRTWVSEVCVIPVRSFTFALTSMQVIVLGKYARSLPSPLTYNDFARTPSTRTPTLPTLNSTPPSRMSQSPTASYTRLCDRIGT